MTWFRSDDGLPDHPKVLELAETRHYKAAMGLWVLAGCWCSKQLTDGAVPRSVVKRLGFGRVEAQALVTCGLWAETDAGYRFHDWAQCNPLRADVEAKRNATAERVKRHRNKAGNALQERTGERVTNAPPDPARPVPTIPDPSVGGVTPTRLAWRDVGLAYAEAYTTATARPVALELHKAAFEAVAVQSGGDLEAVKRSLAAFMADEWAREHDWPPAVWAKQFGRHLDGLKAPEETTDERRKRLWAEVNGNAAG